MLIAVVTGTILLLIAYGMASIALKQQVLNSSARESQIAFYAADSGLECALYLDTKFKAFAASVFQATDIELRDRTNFTISDYCGYSINGKDITISRSVFTVGTDGKVKDGFGTDKTDKIEFTIYYGSELSNSCAKVTVRKSVVSSNDSTDGQLETTVDAKGYNTCEGSPRRLERGVQAIYYEAFEAPIPEEPVTP
jgi:hypothetical protein